MIGIGVPGPGLALLQLPLGASGGGGGGGGDAGAFLLNWSPTDHADTDALQAALADESGPFFVDYSGAPSFEIDPTVQIDGARSLKAKCDYGSIYFKDIVQSPKASWMLWSHVVQPGFLTAHEAAVGGNYTDQTVKLSEAFVYNTGLDENQGMGIMFVISGADPVVRAEFNLYSSFSNYDGTGDVISTIPLAAFRDGLPQDFALLIENLYDVTAKISGIHLRLFHRGAPSGSVWTLLAELALAKEAVAPDAFESWRSFGINTYLVNALASDENDFISLGRIRVADALVNTDPMSVGEMADPASRNAPDGAANNVPVSLTVVDPLVLDEDYAGEPIVVMEALNSLGLDLMMYGLTPVPNSVTFDDDAVAGWMVPPTYEAKVTPKANGTTTAHAHYSYGDGITKDLAVNASNQSGWAGDNEVADLTFDPSPLVIDTDLGTADPRDRITEILNANGYDLLAGGKVTIADLPFGSSSFGNGINPVLSLNGPSSPIVTANLNGSHAVSINTPVGPKTVNFTISNQTGRMFEDFTAISSGDLTTKYGGYVVADATGVRTALSGGGQFSFPVSPFSIGSADLWAKIRFTADAAFLAAEEAIDHALYITPGFGGRAVVIPGSSMAEGMPQSAGVTSDSPFGTQDPIAAIVPSEYEDGEVRELILHFVADDDAETFFCEVYYEGTLVYTSDSQSFASWGNLPPFLNVTVAFQTDPDQTLFARVLSVETVRGEVVSNPFAM